jgi:hypothetical protein
MFNELDKMWQVALQAKTRADLYGGVDSITRRRLDDDEAHAREVRSQSWNAVVAANGQVHEAATGRRPGHARTIAVTSPSWRSRCSC